MFDPRPIMDEHELQDPILTPVPAEFPHTDEVPEGCIVLDDLHDDWGHYVDFYTDVVYTERDQMPLHVHILEPKIHFGAPEEEERKETKWPCIVYIQGSAFHKQWLWNNIARHVRMAQRGYVIAIAEHRPSEVKPFPAQMQDAKTAIRFMRMNAEKYNVDPDHIAVAGDSSGGHTALMAGFTGNDAPDTDTYSKYSAEVNCIIDVYGPTVFSLMNYYPSSQNHYAPESPEGFEIGQKNVLENPELANATIPMNYLSEDKPTPPTLVIHGGRDMLVPFNQSCQLYNYMKKLGKDVTFYKINHASHGGLGFDNDTILNIVEDFLKENI
ncbi:MAG: alpha/beta hydrolase [Hespellia sp.]|nr:alpha/beta hydrolase [Hespellia sp.]